jgi:hypothetical protein
MNKQEYNELNLITSYVTTQTVYEDSMDRCKFGSHLFLTFMFNSEHRKMQAKQQHVYKGMNQYTNDV